MNPAAEDATPWWHAFRAEMPVAATWAYLDHAAVAPLSAPAARAITAWTQNVLEAGAAEWPRHAAGLERLRGLAAKLLNASRTEIALVRSTTEGINLVAEGYPWRPGDNVVTLADEFPSNQYPWMHLADRGVTCRRVATVEGRVDLDQVLAACDGRTRLVSVSWVGYASGWRNRLSDLAEAVHARGAHLFVDAIQGLGVFPLDVQEVPLDFLAADGHKWLLGPEGAGIFYLREEHLDLLRPVGVGWNSVRQGTDFARIELNFKPDASRYEGGTWNMVGFLGLAASLELLLRWPAAQISQRVLDLTDLACERLRERGAVVHSPRDADHASGIVSFEIQSQDPQVLRKRCHQARILLSCRGGRLRISPHAYNDTSDLERMEAVLFAGSDTHGH